MNIIELKAKLNELGLSLMNIHLKVLLPIGILLSYIKIIAYGKFFI